MYKSFDMTSDQLTISHHPIKLLLLIIIEMRGAAHLERCPILWRLCGNASSAESRLDVLAADGVSSALAGRGESST